MVDKLEFRPLPPDRPIVYDEDVQFTVYRPGTVRPEVWYDLLAFAHLSKRRADAPPGEPDPVEEVRRQAERLLAERADEYQDVTQDSGHSVPRDGEITFLPEIPGFQFNPPRRVFRWVESVHSEHFRFRASAALDGRTARGRLTVFLGGIILAEVTLSVRVDSRHAAPPTSTPALRADHARPYRKIFASYSHKDVEVVRQFELYARTIGDEFLRDKVTIRSGQVWNDRLKEMIRESDVFQLFWSTNAMRSTYVREEWEYALSLGRDHFVRPTYWEDPLPSSPQDGLPPDVLRRLHFQRVMVALAGTPHDPKADVRYPPEPASPVDVVRSHAESARAAPVAGFTPEASDSDGGGVKPMSGFESSPGFAAPARPGPREAAFPTFTEDPFGPTPPTPSFDDPDEPPRPRTSSPAPRQYEPRPRVPRPVARPRPPAEAAPTVDVSATRGGFGPAADVEPRVLVIQFSVNPGEWEDLRRLNPEGDAIGREAFGRPLPWADFLAVDHVRFHVGEHGLTAEEGETVNGVFLQVPPVQPVELTVGARLRIGQQMIEYTSEAPAPAGSPPPPRGLGGEAFRSRSATPPGFLDLLSADGGPSIRFPLMPRDGTWIGRDARACDLALVGDASVSRLHARVFRRDGRTWFEDLGSTNGSFLRIRGETPLRAGPAEVAASSDVLLIGDVLIRVVELPPAPHR